MKGLSVRGSQVTVARDSPAEMGVLGRLAALGPFFAVGSHPPGAPPASPWRPFSELTGPAEAMRDRLASVSAAMAAQAARAAAAAPSGSGSRAADAGSRPADEVDPRVAASALHLSLAARLVSPALGSAVLGHPLDMRPGGLWWQNEVGGPVPLSVPWPAPVPEEWGQRLIDEMIAPFTAAVAGLVRVSDRVLWGNVASAINAAAAQAGRQRPDLAGDAWRIAAELFGSPNLSHEWRPPGWGFRRTSCCLFYRIVPGSPVAVCGDCVLRELPPARRS